MSNTQDHSEAHQDTRYGASVRRRRDEKGMTISELADRSGVSHSYLSLIERDLRVPTRKVKSAIEAAFEGHRQIVTKAHAPNESITDNELALVKMWRKLPEPVRSYHFKVFRSYLGLTDE